MLQFLYTLYGHTLFGWSPMDYIYRCSNDKQSVETLFTRSQGQGLGMVKAIVSEQLQILNLSFNRPSVKRLQADCPNKVLPHCHVHVVLFPETGLAYRYNRFSVTKYFVFDSIFYSNPNIKFYLSVTILNKLYCLLTVQSFIYEPPR